MESKTIEEILDYLCNDLGGSWFLAGGALVRLNFDANRGTEDMDLVRIAHPELSDEMSRNLLFQWLIARGLGPEWVNMAVEPFVNEVDEWKKEIVPLRRGTKGEVFRPNLTLFIYLKLRRGTEIDLKDIQAAIKTCPEKFDEPKFMKWANSNLQKRFVQNKERLGL